MSWRTLRALEELRRLGYSDAFVLENGILDLTSSGSAKILITTQP